MEQLAAAGVPVGVLVAPIVPALNDHEMLPILAASASAGASFASYVVLRLPLSVEPVFCEWLQRHYPDRFDKVLNQLKAFRGGQRNSSEFGVRMRGTGAVADRLSQMLHIGCKRHGLGTQGPELSRTAFRRVEPGQLPLELF
jgi:DNA repair photolyase